MTTENVENIKRRGLTMSNRQLVKYNTVQYSTVQYSTAQYSGLTMSNPQLATCKIVIRINEVDNSIVTGTCLVFQMPGILTVDSWFLHPLLIIEIIVLSSLTRLLTPDILHE